jgi:hypothetical protein
MNVSPARIGATRAYSLGRTGLLASRGKALARGIDEDLKPVGRLGPRSDPGPAPTRKPDLNIRDTNNLRGIGSVS